MCDTERILRSRKRRGNGNFNYNEDTLSGGEDSSEIYALHDGSEELPMREEIADSTAVELGTAGNAGLLTGREAEKEIWPCSELNHSLGGGAKFPSQPDPESERPVINTPNQVTDEVSAGATADLTDAGVMIGALTSESDGAPAAQDTQDRIIALITGLFAENQKIAEEQYAILHRSFDRLQDQCVDFADDLAAHKTKTSADIAVLTEQIGQLPKQCAEDSAQLVSAEIGKVREDIIASKASTDANIRKLGDEIDHHANKLFTGESKASRHATVLQGYGETLRLLQRNARRGRDVLRKCVETWAKYLESVEEEDERQYQPYEDGFDPGGTGEYRPLSDYRLDLRRRRKRVRRGGRNRKPRERIKDKIPPTAGNSNGPETQEENNVPAGDPSRLADIPGTLSPETPADASVHAAGVNQGPQ